ncbi:MAG: L-threonylcarbamoyladenylate synthase [Gammaproteobacteria bacterium]|nr:L-threonylcarbamoyladenylate synthase [Gammaproteobacteria bacterium]
MNATASDEDADIAKAVAVLGNGGIVAHACEGVWGLACDPWSETAVTKILSIKHRDETKGLIVIAHDSCIFDAEICELELNKQEMVRGSWPGHTTWILPSERFSKLVTGDRLTIALRVPDHKQARELCRRYGKPLVSTSANISNKPPAKTRAEIHEILGSVVDFVLPGRIGDATGPSTIRDALTGAKLR